MRRTVRWNTEHEEDDIAMLVDAVSDDVARALDYCGWMIVPNPDAPNDGWKWPVGSDTGYVPAWAEDECAKPKPKPKLQLVKTDKE